MLMVGTSPVPTQPAHPPNALPFPRASLPTPQIAVAAHSAILLAIFNAVLTTDTDEARKWFGTGEMRTVLLTFKGGQ